MKKPSGFKMKNPSIAKLAKEAGKPSVLKSDITKGVFDVMTKRKGKLIFLYQARDPKVKAIAREIKRRARERVNK